MPPIFPITNHPIGSITSHTANVPWPSSDGITFHSWAPPGDEYLVGKGRGGWKLYRIEAGNVGIYGPGEVFIFFHEYHNKKESWKCHVKATRIGKKLICPSCGCNPPRKLLTTAALINPEFMALINNIDFTTSHHTTISPLWPASPPMVAPTWQVNISPTTDEDICNTTSGTITICQTVSKE